MAEKWQKDGKNGAKEKRLENARKKTATFCPRTAANKGHGCSIKEGGQRSCHEFAAHRGKNMATVLAEVSRHSVRARTPKSHARLSPSLPVRLADAGP